MTLNNDPGSPLKSQKVQAALSQLHGHLTQPEAMERAFIAALQGAIVNEIGRCQVYSDYKKNETVIFIHDPVARSEHKYIFAVAGNHTYIVAAPMEWTEYHKFILARVSAAAGKPAHCPGGGYVGIGGNGVIWVDRRSGDFGPGDHKRAKEALERAVRATALRQSSPHVQ